MNLFVVLLWRTVRSGQVCEDCSGGWDVLDSSDRPICCCRMEFWVCNCYLCYDFFFVLERPMVGEVVYVKEKGGPIMGL